MNITTTYWSLNAHSVNCSTKQLASASHLFCRKLVLTLSDWQIRQITLESVKRKLQVRKLPYNQPTQCGLSKGAVDALASNIAKQVNYEPGDDLYPVVARLGGRIVINNLWEVTDATSGSIRIEDDGSFVIALASHTGKERDRFTIAHELGHYVLHYLWPNQNGVATGPIEAMRYGSGKVEWEANWFAAGFLMPAQEFTRAWEELGGVLSMLADRFGVSSDAARIRVETLNLQ